MFIKNPLDICLGLILPAEQPDGPEKAPIYVYGVVREIFADDGFIYITLLKHMVQGKFTERRKVPGWRLHLSAKLLLFLENLLQELNRHELLGREPHTHYKNG